MPIKSYKPTSAGRRISSVEVFEGDSKRPERKLVRIKKKWSGRTKGKITVRHRGGGHKRYIRLVDFFRQKFEIPAKVEAIEYDPNRGARLALLIYKDGTRSYIIAPCNLQVGEVVITSQKKGEPKIGSRFFLKHIPSGTEIYDIELQKGKGSRIVRAAGTSAQLMAIEGSKATVRLPSGEVRFIDAECMATIGRVSNPDHRLIRWGKAGRVRHRGIRPTVRGKAMNPVDHPHGGGEGRDPIGLKHPKTPKGKPALGVKTRRRKLSDKFILQRRKKGRFVGA
ncbi:50S ribosomal protein L2 [Candidatus Uhrbacteria bacterium CG_4_9_14_3_um_filter_36_7]|uniref:Large ribosomal subunit protein uL2 n=1 Tax=Candidatus Uhrbacteria bacterium CG_4_9_14_3_um_filter_36_7 TaxID=1975033 RepID=A0A2M7XHK2_9BACT|nr:MAG: 50S ribosomal protein L2 [Candidatus Uhrbacteria bacterium CG_4_9_14_3_um_filter_36_7]